MANITEFKSRLSGGGVRPNQFKVRLTFPDIATAGAGASGVNLMDDLSFLCEATTLPGQTIGKTSVKFRGRELKLAGDSRTFEDWGIDVLMDTDFKLYDAFTNWMNAINSHGENDRTITGTDYQVDAEIVHYTKNGDVAKKITMINCWPASIAAIELGWDQNDALEEFSVTWQYDYWQARDNIHATT